jgi:hypothetical protein
MSGEHDEHDEPLDMWIDVTGVVAGQILRRRLVVVAQSTPSRLLRHLLLSFRRGLALSLHGEDEDARACFCGASAAERPN